MSQTIAVVLNWRDAPSTISCARSLMALDEDLSIVLVDNASGDGSLAAMAEFCAREAAGFGYSVLAGGEVATAGQARFVVVVDSGRNGGYAFGNNVGIRIALNRPECRYIWILNNDTLVPEAPSLTRLVAKMEASPDIGLCGSTVVFEEDRLTVQTLGGGLIDAKMRGGHIGKGTRLGDPIDEAAVEARMTYVNGAATFVRRDLVETVGVMTEDYFLYYEEADWAERAKERYRLGYCAESVVYHVMGKSIGNHTDKDGGDFSLYYLTASKLKFCRRWRSSVLPRAFADTVIGALRSMRQGQPKRAKALARALLGMGPPSRASASIGTP